MSKIIVSSSSMFYFLRNVNALSDNEELITITGKKEKSELRFSTGTGFNCEIQKDFEFQTTVQHLKNLREVLGKVADQPITMEFPDSSQWIIIKIEV